MQSLGTGPKVGRRSVKLDKLVKTLRREVTAHPAKASALGGLLLVGSYFWGPLIWKVVRPKEHAAAIPMASATPIVDQASLQGISRTSSVAIPLNWLEIREKRKRDPFTQSAVFQHAWREAFFSTTPTQGAEVAATEQRPLVETVDPRKLGLMLEGVLIGAKNRRAIISGKVYYERDQIKVNPNSESTPPRARQPEVEFRLVRVSRKTVELERQGKVWQLVLGGTEDDSPGDAATSRSQ